MATVLTSYYRPKPGGLCTRLFRAVRALLERGHTVHYLAVEPFPIAHPNCIFHRFPWPRRHSDSLLFWGVFLFTSPLYLFYLAVSRRVTHAFAFGTFYAFCMQPLRWAGLVELTCFLRGDAIMNHRLRRRPEWIIRLEKWIEGVGIRGVHLVAVAPHLISSVQRRHTRMLPERYAILPNDIKWLPRVIERKPHAPISIALVGVIEPMKNYGFVVDLLREFSRFEWRLSIYGEGPDKTQLAAQVRREGLDDRIVFMGWRKPADIWPHVDLLLFPSLHEGMPNTVLEAIAAHVGVVASDIPAHRTVLPAQHLIPLEDRSGWRCALKEVLEDPQNTLERLVHRQAASARRLVFDWDAAVTKLIIAESLRIKGAGPVCY